MIKSLSLNHLVYREYHLSPDKPYVFFLHHAEKPTVLNVPLSHFHNYVEIGIYYRSKGSVFIEGQVHPLISDGFFLVPALQAIALCLISPLRIWALTTSILTPSF